MKFVVFGDGARLGLLEHDKVLDLAQAARTLAQNSEAAFSSLSSLIESGSRGLDLARTVAEKARGTDAPGVYSQVSSVRLHAPWPGERLVLAGANNADHVANCFNNKGAPRTKAEVHASLRKGSPSAFWGVARPIMGPGATIEIPARANGLFDYEGEPAVVLGKRGKDIKAKDLKDYVWGVTMVVDWSIREEVWPPKPMNPLVFGKNFDCSKSMGPCIAVDEVDLDDWQLETWVNGTLRQSHNTRDMIFSFGEVLEYLSQDFSFFPGDVLSGGTGAGTAFDQTVANQDGTWPRDLFLKPGDTVEIRSPMLGSLAGHVVAKSS